VNQAAAATARLNPGCRYGIGVATADLLTC
jgi:hypothetical protein